MRISIPSLYICWKYLIGAPTFIFKECQVIKIQICQIKGTIFLHTTKNNLHFEYRSNSGSRWSCPWSVGTIMAFFAFSWLKVPFPFSLYVNGAREIRANERTTKMLHILRGLPSPDTWSSRVKDFCLNYGYCDHIVDLPSIRSSREDLDVIRNASNFPGEPKIMVQEHI